MKIEREGKFIELTEDEVWEAYKEQQHKNDIQNIEDNMENHLSNNEYEIFCAYPEIVEFAANMLRENEDEGHSYEYSLTEAIAIAKETYTEWKKSDDLQFVKITGPCEFTLAEAREDEVEFVLCKGTVDVSEYLKKDGTFDEEAVKIIVSYYGDMENFCNCYSNIYDRMQLFAEMVFEQIPYYELHWKVVQINVEEELEKFKED